MYIIRFKIPEMKGNQKKTKKFITLEEFEKLNYGVETPKSTSKDKKTKNNGWTVVTKGKKNKQSADNAPKDKEDMEVSSTKITKPKKNRKDIPKDIPKETSMVEVTVPKDPEPDEDGWYKCCIGSYRKDLIIMFDKETFEIVTLRDHEMDLCDARQRNNFIEICHYEDRAVKLYTKLCYRYAGVHDRQQFEYEKERLLSKYTRYDNPVSMKTLCKMLKAGQVHMGVTVEKGCFVSYVGHVCDLVIPMINECIANKTCTYNVTKDNFILQKAYRCHTCYEKQADNSVCEACINVCHKNHVLEQLPTLEQCKTLGTPNEIDNLDRKAHCYCDCGHFGKCKILRKTY